MNRYRHLPTYRYYPEEGYPLNLEKSVGKDLRNYKIHGNSLNGENLFVIKSDHTYTASGITMTAKTGNNYFTLNGTVTTTSNTSGVIANNLGLFEAGTYKVEVDGLNSITSILDRILIKNANVSEDIVVNNITTNTPQTFTLEEDTELKLQYVLASGSTYDNKKIRVNITKVPNIEEPVEILSVGDYDETTGKYKIPVKVNDVTTNIFLDEPLRKVNEYHDYIDFKKQKVIRNIVTHTTDTTEPWTFSTVYSNTVSFYASAYRINGYGTTGNSGRLNILSDKLLTKNATDIECVKCTGEVTTQNNGLVNITLLKSRIGYEDTDTNVQAVVKLKTWLSSNPINFIWCINEFAEPIEEEITLPTIPTHKGTNIIEVDTTIEPTLQVQYYK